MFNLIDEQSLVVSDNTIVNIFQDLYYPNSSYEFNVVDPYIIGQIYETFLTETITISGDGDILCVKKPEAVDAQGAVSTPKNIADFIVEETLNRLINNEETQSITDLRIGDLCCGSGNFLLSAFEYLINYTIEHYKNTSKEESIRHGVLLPTSDEQTFILSYKIKRDILTNNIFGVDIDPLAVEVTKLSLLIKLIENVTTNEIDDFMDIFKQKALPDLEGNVKNGNSLVDSTYASYDPNIFEDMDLMVKINMFDWADEFDGKKFNAIIGNPPYIRVQKMVHYSPEEYRYYKSGFSRYETAEAELLDKYYLFIERGLSLLSDNGLLGYIIPHRFMNTGSGEALRKLISTRKALARITHFGTNQVFLGRSTYTCVMLLSAIEQNEFEIGFVQDWNRFLFEHKIPYDTYKTSTLGKDPWLFILPTIITTLRAVASHCRNLDELAEIFVGVQTSADSIYLLTPYDEDDTYVYFYDKKQNLQKLERNILKKSLYDCQIKKYERIKPNTYIIFPYKILDNKPVLYSVEEMESLFPFAYNYLCTHRDELAKRNMPNRTESTWYGYGRSQSIKRFFGGKHLIWPVLSVSSNYVYDDAAIVITGGGNGPFYGLELRPESQISIFYIQAVLNYWLLENLVKATASTFRGDYYSHGKQFIASLPIYSINFDKPEEVRAHTDIVQSVRKMMNLKERRKSVRTQVKINMIDRAILAIEIRIEKTLDSLYGITRNEQDNT